jgi:hypothetical protein
MLLSIIAWPGHKSADEDLCAMYKGQTLQYKCVPLEDYFEENLCIQHFVLASIPVQSIHSDASLKFRPDKRLFEYEMSGYRICWTMVATQNVAGKNHWTTVDYFSTLDIGSIPESGTAFFSALVTTVSAAWIRLCNDVDGHLARCVSCYNSKLHYTRTTLTHACNSIAPGRSDWKWRGSKTHRQAAERCQHLDWTPPEARGPNSCDPSIL